MEFLIHEHRNIKIAELLSGDLVISEVQDALDLMVNAEYQGAHKLIIREHHLTPEFFNLKSRLAGEILQKFSTYSFGLAIIGDFDEYPSESLRDFIRESNRKKEILFLRSLDEIKDIW